MKSIADNLLLARSPISTHDLITQTLAGLDIEYNPILVQLSDKINLTCVGLQVALLSYENKINLSVSKLTADNNVLIQFVVVTLRTRK